MYVHLFISTIRIIANKIYIPAHPPFQLKKIYSTLQVRIKSKNLYNKMYCQLFLQLNVIVQTSCEKKSLS
jgi:hypothetical protein